MSRSYSASTRKRLWRLVISIARPGLPRCVGGEKSVGREDGGPGRPCQPVSISGLDCSSRDAPLDQSFYVPTLI